MSRFSDFDDDDRLILSDDEPRYSAYKGLDESYSSASLDTASNPLTPLSQYSLSLPPDSVSFRSSRSYGGLSDDTGSSRGFGSNSSRTYRSTNSRDSDTSYSPQRYVLYPSPAKVKNYGVRLSLVNYRDEKGRKYEYDGVIYYIVNDQFATKDEFNDLVNKVLEE